jgi:DNA mismatch endonuclease, patch repair protein
MNDAARQKIMRSIPSKDTKPEKAIRKTLTKFGIGYRLHVPGLPGKPDIVVRKHRALILVNGCFWHAHGCHLSGSTQRLSAKWESKIKANVSRDRINRMKYDLDDWKTLVVWECAIQGKSKIPIEVLESRIVDWVIYCKRNSEVEGFSS